MLPAFGPLSSRDDVYELKPGDQIAGFNVEGEDVRLALDRRVVFDAVVVGVDGEDLALKGMKHKECYFYRTVNLFMTFYLSTGRQAETLS